MGQFLKKTPYTLTLVLIVAPEIIIPLGSKDPWEVLAKLLAELLRNHYGRKTKY